MEVNETEEMSFEDGRVLLLDKPLHWTSFDVVKKIRNAIRVKKIGHAGTLDPLATGLLILCTGKFTKKIDIYQQQEKEYTGTITIGKTTPSYDLETDFDSQTEHAHITLAKIKENASELTGLIQQIPPIFSAIKQKGEPVYKLARQKKEVKLEPREVHIKVFEILAYESSVVTFRIVCSKGTYIRSIAHDIGAKLGVGAHLSSLRRTKIGEFDVANAWQLDDFLEKNRISK